jgi:enoyl-CoA hydratase/carnithine racemase
MEFCTVERDGHLIVVMVNRPTVRNALHRAATDELDGVWDAFEADPDLRVAILTGAGDRAFCAGYDVRESGERRGAAFLADRHPRGIGGLTHRFGMTKPIIAAVNGFALGGGFELALACDLIVAAEHAEFGFPEPRIGLMAMDGGMHRLARHVPLKLAMGLLLTGRRVSAREAQQIGFVNQVVPLAELLPAARRWAELILACAPLSVQGTKEMTIAGLDLPLPAAMGLLTPAASRAMTSADQDEGVAAFREKRAPRWSGR